jgi:NADPH:quinone reductase-like Zn-dependent oxidoreductase
MKAAVCSKYGGPDVLHIQEVPTPVPKDDEVLVETHAVAVATEDLMNRRGVPLFTRLFTGLTRPRKPILGAEFAGRVQAVGKDVTSFKEGDSVLGSTGTAYGCYAEYFCIPESGFLAIKPDSLPYEAAAPVCGVMAAWNFLVDKAQVQKGQKILVIGASGAVGTAAVQVARHLGAEVTGVCSAKNLALVTSLGADHTIDYASEDFATNGECYDVILDLAGKTTFSRCKKSLQSRGLYISAVLSFRVLADMMLTSLRRGKRTKFSATGLLPVQKRLSFLSELLPLFEEKSLTTIIDRRYSLEQIADAHRYVEDGHKTGNVLLVMKRSMRTQQSPAGDVLRAAPKE